VYGISSGIPASENLASVVRQSSAASGGNGPITAAKNPRIDPADIGARDNEVAVRARPEKQRPSSTY
jgi:hypothetical protein